MRVKQKIGNFKDKIMSHFTINIVENYSRLKKSKNDDNKKGQNIKQLSK